MIRTTLGAIVRAVGWLRRAVQDLSYGMFSVQDYCCNHTRPRIADEGRLPESDVTFRKLRRARLYVRRSRHFKTLTLAGVRHLISPRWLEEM